MGEIWECGERAESVGREGSVEVLYALRTRRKIICVITVSVKPGDSP